jgi:hypothetical protein
MAVTPIIAAAHVFQLLIFCNSMGPPFGYDGDEGKFRRRQFLDLSTDLQRGPLPAFGGFLRCCGVA